MSQWGIGFQSRKRGFEIYSIVTYFESEQKSYTKKTNIKKEGKVVSFYMRGLLGRYLLISPVHVRVYNLIKCYRGLSG